MHETAFLDNFSSILHSSSLYLVQNTINITINLKINDFHKMIYDRAFLRNSRVSRGRNSR